MPRSWWSTVESERFNCRATSFVAQAIHHQLRHLELSRRQAGQRPGCRVPLRRRSSNWGDSREWRGRPVRHQMRAGRPATAANTGPSARCASSAIC